MLYFPDTPSLLDDAEMLQTDVMRFFAILCLCLMAIFALVKTLPMAPPETGPAIMEPADQKTDAKLLQKKIAALKERLDELQTRSTSGDGRCRTGIGPGYSRRQKRKKLSATGWL